MGFFMGAYVAVMKNISKKLRIQVSIVPTILLLGLAIFYMSYDFLAVDIKKATADIYKLFLNFRNELFIFGGMSLGMLGRWKQMELCPYQLLRTIILLLFPLITIGLFYMQSFIPTSFYVVVYLLWGLQATIYIWMSLRLTAENQKKLFLAHTFLIIFLGFQMEFSYILSTWGWMSFTYYIFNQFIYNSQKCDNIKL